MIASVLCSTLYLFHANTSLHRTVALSEPEGIGLAFAGVAGNSLGMRTRPTEVHSSDDTMALAATRTVARATKPGGH